MGKILDFARLLRARRQEEKILPGMMEEMDLTDLDISPETEKVLEVKEDFDIEIMSNISVKKYFVMTLTISLLVGIVAATFGVLLDRLVPVLFF